MGHESNALDERDEKIKSLNLDLNVYRFILKVLPYVGAVLGVLLFLVGGAVL